VRLVVTEFVARSFDLDHMDLFWKIADFDAVHEAITAYDFYILRSESPEGPFETIAGPFQDQYTFRDFGSNLLHKWRRLYYVLRIIHKPTDEEIKVGPVALLAEPDLIALEIQRQEDALFRQFTGRRCWVFPVRTFGPKCSCYDPVMGRRSRSGCIECFDTGYVGGFLRPIEFYMQVDPNPSSSQPTALHGEKQPRNTSARCGAYPLLKPKDIIVEPENIRWKVVTAVSTERLRSAVHQELSLTQIPRGDIEYKLPINLEDLANQKFSEELNFTNPQQIDSLDHIFDFGGLFKSKESINVSDIEPEEPEEPEPPSASAFLEESLPIDPGAEGGPVLSGAAVYVEASGGLPARITRSAPVTVDAGFPSTGTNSICVVDHERFVVAHLNMMALVRTDGTVLGTWSADTPQFPEFVPAADAPSGEGEVWCRETTTGTLGRYSLTGTKLGTITLSGAASNASNWWTKIPGAETVWASAGATSGAGAAIYEFSSVTGAATGRSISKPFVRGLLGAPEYLYVSAEGTTVTTLQRYTLSTLSVLNAEIPAFPGVVPGYAGDSGRRMEPRFSASGTILVDSSFLGVDEYDPDTLALIRRVAQGATWGLDVGLFGGVWSTQVGRSYTEVGEHAVLLTCSVGSTARTGVRIHDIREGVATWTLPADPENARTLRTVSIPGALATALGVDYSFERVMLERRVGSGAWVAFDAGEFLGDEVPVGEEVQVRARFLDPRGKGQAPDPWIGTRSLNSPSRITAHFGVEDE
jgi:hypothetical protein